MLGDQSGLEFAETPNTTALLKRLTQIVTLQQTQITQLSLRSSKHLTPPAPPVVTTEGPSSTISVKLDGTNYSIWSQVVKVYVKGRGKTRHITGDPPLPLPCDMTYQKWSIETRWSKIGYSTRLRQSLWSTTFIMKLLWRCERPLQPLFIMTMTKPL